MGKIIRIIRRILLFASILVCAYLTALNLDDVKLDADTNLYIIEEYVNPYYDMLSDNVGLTSINGISNVYINMKTDGYSVYKEDITEDTIDVSFVKEGAPSYRFYYVQSEGKLTFFCDDYESSYTGLSYIIERKE